MSTEADRTVEVEFDQEAYERLSAVSDTPAELLHDAAIDHVELAEAIAYTREGGFHGPDGFAKMADDTYPTWPLGSVLGIELESMGNGESRWTIDAGPDHANPMATVHAVALCDFGDAALNTAYMHTLEIDELFGRHFYICKGRYLGLVCQDGCQSGRSVAVHHHSERGSR